MCGSSLRVRGAGRAGTRVPRCDRVIPACAGSGSARPSVGAWPSGHPCVCGERFWAEWTQPGYGGSSLRVRGAAEGCRSVTPLAGVIPACAGNSSGSRERTSVATSHPCVCGERHDVVIAGEAQDGSSLRVRGTGQVSRPLPIDPRVIPACAGNGPQPGPGRRFRSGHPRVCGERDRLSTTTAARRWSSPRVRGTDGSTGST